jgi:membrane fusion protein, copper/silver efflux system
MKLGTSRMRQLSLAVAVVLAIAAAYGLGRHNSYSQTASRKGQHVLYYVDPMHPDYKSDKPGIAPDCGMQLEPIYAEDIKNEPTRSSLAQLPAGAVSIDGPTQRLLGIRLATVERSSATRIVRVVGRVIPEDTRMYRINSGVDGFIRETYEDSVGTLIKKDRRLATYYSPEFLSVASGFLAASERVPGAVGNDGARTVPFPGALAKQGVSSLQGYTDRLRNLGMSDVQIKRVADSRQLPESIDVVAPVDGFILARNISPGQHFDHGMEFYRIADLGRVWVVAEVYEQETSYLRPGGLAQITLRDEGPRLSARITDSLPQSEAGGGTVKLRLEVDNPRFILRPEMLVDVELPVRLPPAVTVPVDALVDSGAHARVYVEPSAGVFEPHEVETGWRNGDQVEIRRGVQPGERVVVSATFLVDSESRLETPGSESPGRFTHRPAGMPDQMAAVKTVKDPSCGKPVDPVKAAASGNTFAYRGTTYYFCSAKCKQAFQNDPARSASKHQGDDDD